MESKQLSVVNITTRPQADTHRAYDRGNSGESEMPQKSTFDEQLDRQVEQLKVPADKVKVDKNQSLESEVPENPELAAVDAASPQGTDIEVAEVHNEVLASLEPMEMDATLISSPVTTVKGAAAPITTAITEGSLPQAGKKLPLTEISQPVTSIRQDFNNPVQQNPGQPHPMLQARPVSDTAVTPQTVTTVTLPETPDALSKLGLQSRPLNMQANQLVGQLQGGVTTESTISEVIAQASRLQQVAQTVQASASPQLMAHSNALPLTASESILAPVSGTSANLNLLSSSIPVPVSHSQWSGQLADQVIMMARGGHHLAEIKLNPANLGPMEIKLTVNDDQASVSFVSQHAAVRDVIDSSLPRLKEMLEQQGLNLAESDVSAQSEGNTEQQTGESIVTANDQSQNDNDATEENTVLSVSHVDDGNVNLYA